MRAVWICRAIVAGSLAVAALTGRAGTPQGPMESAVPVVLTTRTPLGEARIEIPAGTPIETFEADGDWVSVHQGPFSGWVALKDTSLNPAPTPEPASTPPPVEPGSSDSSRGAETAEKNGFRGEPSPPPDHVRAGVTVIPVFTSPFVPAPPSLPLYWALAFLAVTSTLAWMLLRRKCDQLTSELKKLRAEKPLPAATIPGPSDKSSPFFPCPLCRANLLIDSLKIGRNTCPSCAQAFICE